MKRRLYFLFPDSNHLRQAFEDLANVGITTENCHVMGRGLPADLPLATWQQQTDFGERLAHSGWYLNFGLFWVATLVALWGAFNAAPGITLGALVFMLLSFLLGNAWTKVPHAHLNEFREAIRHGEILLMVDVPRNQITEVEDLMHRRHPEAVVGGVGWSSRLLNT